MSNAPTFFFSHARQDRETPGRYLIRFFQDLESKLAQWAGIDLKIEKLGTIDSRIEHGHNWDETLSRALATNRAFIAILTPLYFKRSNCGKELTVAILRSPEVGLDANGALTGIQNILPIRWLPESSYYSHTPMDSLIPAILRLIEDVPADPLDDPARTRAIQRYRKKGMEWCVDPTKAYYRELIDLFVERVITMADLPPASFEVSFAKAHSAFELDWPKHLRLSAAGPGTRPESPTPNRPVALRALNSVAVFYVTRRSLLRDPNRVQFADSLIAEAPLGLDPAISDLLADVRGAVHSERLNIFHCATDPAVPDSAEAIISQLAHLSERDVLVALMVDSAIWPASEGTDATIVEQTIASDRWAGPVLIATLDPEASTLDPDALVSNRNLSRRVIVLPRERHARVAALRITFVDTRGGVLQTKRGHFQGKERLPLLEGIHAP